MSTIFSYFIILLLVIQYYDVGGKGILPPDTYEILRIHRYLKITAVKIEIYIVLQ